MSIIDIKCHFINCNKEFVHSTETLCDIKYYDDLSYQTFFEEHMMKNIPCVIKCACNNWLCLKWTANNKPDFEYLREKFGNTSVPVANCSDRYYNAQKKEEQSLEQYLEYWRLYISKNYSQELPCLYLKDWHFTRDFPEQPVYQVPNVFASDWLNEYFTDREDVYDDYRFVYMGPKTSWTPLHADVFSSFSWSVNICGKKRWVLFPPGQEKYLVDEYGKLTYDIESTFTKDKPQYKTYNLNKSFEIIQNPGEAIFVPSGWHHQVWNLDDTISINHNWVNGCNIDKMWLALLENLDAVKSEISDCQEMDGWNEHCQTMLNATFGLDFKQFCNFILYIVRVRLKHLTGNECLKIYGGWMIGAKHLMFDLSQARNVLIKLLSNEDFIALNYFQQAECDIRKSLEEVDTIMDRK